MLLALILFLNFELLLSFRSSKLVIENLHRFRLENDFTRAALLGSPIGALYAYSQGKQSIGSPGGKKTSRAPPSSPKGSQKQVQPSSSRPKIKTVSNAADSSSGDIRINKCLPGLSRRGADEAIAEGRVTVNGKPASSGMRVSGNDVVRLDGKIQRWEGLIEAKRAAPATRLEDRGLMYVKYWKPVGVTCTSEKSDKTNIITAGRFDLFPQRMFTVGRLDKDSTGLILLTSDGRVNEAMLRPSVKKEKHYAVEFDKVPTDAQITSLREGVVITTEAQRSGAKPLTAKTRPCKVTRLPGTGGGKAVEVVLTEGRNRQIRKMAEAVGLHVVKLHRTSFAGITLKGVTEGNWAELTEKEMTIIQNALTNTNTNRGNQNSQGQDEQQNANKDGPDTSDRKSSFNSDELEDDME